MRNIWAEDDEDYIDEEIELAKLTEEDIKEAEKEFNVNFPKEYIELLKIKNGGYLKYQALPVNFKNSWADDHVPLQYLYGIKKNKGIFTSKALLKEWGIRENNFITLSGDGHTWIVLDYRNNKEEPEITYIDIEANIISVIFKTFKEMIENLYEPTIDDIDLSEYNDELSVERGKMLCKSNSIDEVLEGIDIWKCSYEELDMLGLTLIDLLENTTELSIHVRASQALFRLITDEYVTEESAIKKAVALTGKFSDSDIKYYHKSIVDFLNNQQ